MADCLWPSKWSWKFTIKFLQASSVYFWNEKRPSTIAYFSLDQTGWIWRTNCSLSTIFQYVRAYKPGKLCVLKINVRFSWKKKDRNEKNYSVKMSDAACKFRADSCHERYEVLTALHYSNPYNETEIPASGQKPFSQAPT